MNLTAVRSMSISPAPVTGPVDRRGPRLSLPIELPEPNETDELEDSFAFSQQLHSELKETIRKRISTRADRPESYTSSEASLHEVRHDFLLYQ